MAFTDQSRRNVADYLTSLDDAFASPNSTGVPDMHSWDPFADQNGLALYPAVEPAMLDDGERASLSLVDFTGNAQVLGAVGGGNGGFSDSFHAMDLSLEHLIFPDCNVSPTRISQSAPTSLTTYSSSCTPEHPMAGLPPLSLYPERPVSSTVGSPQQYSSFDDSSGYAVQEDKRIRNTAASARFRVKKKQRDSIRERSVKEVQDNIARLEANVAQLEIENKWLKDLASQKMEKMMANSETGSKAGAERSDDWNHSGPKDGVGTSKSLD